MKHSDSLTDGQTTDPKAPVHPATLALARVPFRGGFILAAAGPVDQEGNRPVPLAPFCEALGLALSPQLAKLKGKPWACVTIIVTQIPGDDQARRVACIPLRALPMWLATIHPGKVAPGARPMLEAFQAEACDVLYRHFLDTPTPAPTLGVLETQAIEVGRLRGQVADLAAEALALRDQLATVGRGLLALGTATPHAPARPSRPRPYRALPPERGAERVWRFLREREITRVTPRDVSRAVKALRRTQDAVAALEVLCHQGIIAPDPDHQGWGRAYLVLPVVVEV